MRAAVLPSLLLVSVTLSCDSTDPITLFDVAFACELDRKDAVFRDARRFSEENQLEFSYNYHTPRGELFIIQMSGKKGFLLVDGFTPDVGVGHVLNSRDHPAKVYLDETGGVAGTKHKLSVSAHSEEPGPQPQLVAAAQRLNIALGKACSAHRNVAAS